MNLVYNDKGDNMKKVVIENMTYELIKNVNDAFVFEDFEGKFTDHFYDYDYIVGDYSYEKLRLKGFYEKNSKKVTAINNIKDLETYIRDYCNYNAKYFLLKKRKKSE